MKSAKYLVSHSFIAQRVPDGVRVVFSEDNTYQWGELIATADFIGEGLSEVEFEATDFSNTDPYYQREMTIELASLIAPKDTASELLAALEIAITYIVPQCDEDLENLRRCRSAIDKATNKTA